jgi:hypothetical protein
MLEPETSATMLALKVLLAMVVLVLVFSNIMIRRWLVVMPLTTLTS